MSFRVDMNSLLNYTLLEAPRFAHMDEDVEHNIEWLFAKVDQHVVPTST